MSNPCYDPKTNTDCPDWAKYLKERDAIYEQRKVERHAASMIFDSRYDRRAAWERKQIRLRALKPRRRG